MIPSLPRHCNTWEATAVPGEWDAWGSISPTADDLGTWSLASGPTTSDQEETMGKTGRKRRARKKKGANHGKRPNA